jgi:uncharacterized protein YjiS (DUF1127 family)
MNIYLSRETLNPASDRLRRSKLIAALRRMGGAIRQNMERRAAINELHSMDDRTLRDLGIYRSDIERVVDGLCDDTRRRRPTKTIAAASARAKKAPARDAVPA